MTDYCLENWLSLLPLLVCEFCL